MYRYQRISQLTLTYYSLLTTTYHLLLTTNYALLTTYYYLLPALIQDISHDQITESRSCGTDDATVAADAADAADAAAATTAADAADAAAANAEAGLSWREGSTRAAR